MNQPEERKGLPPLGARVEWDQPGVGRIEGVVEAHCPRLTLYADVRPPGVKFRDVDEWPGIGHRDRCVVRVEGEHGPYCLPRADRLRVLPQAVELAAVAPGGREVVRRVLVLPAQVDRVLITSTVGAEIPDGR